MTIGAGLALASAWAAVGVATWVMQKDVSPFGVAMFLAIGVWATAYIVGIKP